MAVYTQVEKESLVAFLEAYDIGTLTHYEGIAEGVENTNYVLHTTTGKYILTLYEKRVNVDDLPFFLGLMGHLSNKDIVCPQIIRRRNNSLYAPLENRYAAITSFLPGKWVAKTNAKHCKQVGEIMALMHLAAQDYEILRKNTLSIQNWRPLWEKVKEKAPLLQEGLSENIESSLLLLEKQWPKFLPEGIIHADLFNDNVFFIDDILSGVIDFYFACHDYLAYDVAIALNAWCFTEDHQYDLLKAQNLLSGYQEIRPLTLEEKEFLPILAQGAAMRFFLTRAYDWFYIPNTGLVMKKDPLEYFKRLKFFRSINKEHEIGLLA